MGDEGTRAGRVIRAARTGPLALLGAGYAALACTPTALDTVDLGDNPEPPDLPLDEAFFYCEIQPKVLSAQRCASGASSDGGGCHLARSALRLLEVPTQASCRAGVVQEAPSPEAQVNLERLRASIGLDAESSPLFRRPLGLDAHPRAIFEAGSEAALLLRTWLDRETAR